MKSGRRKEALPGVAEFMSQFKNVRPLLVGGDGVPFEEFFQRTADEWF
jgi:hypothetical protein